jgi:CheY-like chemotaxis protein
MEDDVRRSHEAGFSKHLTKPVSLQALEAAIRQTVRDNKVAQR